MPGSPPIRPPSPPQAGPSSSNGARASEAQPRRRFPKPPNLSDVARVHHCYVYRVVEEPPSPPAYVIPNDIGDSLSDTQLLEWSVQFARAFRTGKYKEYTFDAAGHLIIRKGARQEADEVPEPIDPPAYQTPMDDRVIEALSSSLATALESDVSIRTAIEELSSSFSTAVLADSSHPTSSEDSEMADNTHNNAFRAMDLADYFASRAAVSIVQDISNAQMLFPGRNNGMPSPILPVARSRQYDHPPEEPQSPDENRCVFIDQLPRPAVESTPPTTSNVVTAASSHPVSPLVTCTGAVSGDSSGPAQSASPETAETEEVSLNQHDQAFCVNNFEEFLDTPAAVANVNDTGNAEVLFVGRNNDMPSPGLPVARRGAHIHPPEEPRSPDENVCVIFPKQLPLPPVDQHSSTSNTSQSATTTEAVATPPTTPIIVTTVDSTPVSPLVTCTGTISGDSTASTADQPTSSSSNRVNDRSVSLSVTCTGPVDVDVTQAAADDETTNTRSIPKSSNVTIQPEEDVTAEQTETNSPTLSDFAKPETSLNSSEKSASSGNTSDSPTVTCSEVVHATTSAVTIHGTNSSVSSSVTSTESVDATPTFTNTTTHSVSSNLVSPLVTCTGTISGASTASIADLPNSSPENRVNDRSVSPSVTCTGPVDVDTTQAATDDETTNTCSTQSSDVTIQPEEDVSADLTVTNSPTTSDFANPESSQNSSEKSISSVNTSDSPTVTCSEVVHATPSAVNNHSTNDSVSSTVTSTESVDATPTTSTNTTRSVDRNPVSPIVTCTGPVNVGSTPPAPSSSVPAPSSSAPGPSSLHGDVERLNQSRLTAENAGGPLPKRHKQPAQTRINSFMEEKRKQARANQERFRISVTGKRSSTRQHAMMLSQLKQIQAFMASQKTSKRTRQHDETSKNEPSAKKMKAPHYHLRAYGMDELRRQAAAKRKAALTLALRKQAAEQHRCTTPTSPPFLVAPPNSPNLAPVCPPRPVRKPIKRRPLVDYESPAKKLPRKRLVDYDDTPPTSPAPIQRRPLVDYDITPPTSPAPIQRRRPLVDYESPAKKHSRKRLVDYDITPPTSPMPNQRRPLVDYQSPPPSPIPQPPSPVAIVKPAPQPLPAPSPVQIQNLPSPPNTPPAIENVPAPEEVPQTPPIQEEARKDIETPKPATTSTEVQTEPVKTLVDCAVQTDPIIEAPFATQTVPAATQTPVLINTDVETQTEPVPTANAEIQVDVPVEPIIEQPEIVPDFEPLQDDIIEPVPEDDQPVEPEEVDDAEPIIDIVQPAPEADEPEPIPEDSDDDEPEADEPEPEDIDDEEDQPNGDEPAEVDIFEPAPMDDIDISSEDDEAPVEQPIPAAQPNQRRRRRQEDPWRNLQRVNRFGDANLPAPAPIAMNLNVRRRHQNNAALDPYLQEFTPLTPTRLLQETGGDRFITGLYEGGIVTLQGRFDGVPRTSDFFARAQHHPEVLYHNPGDGIEQVVIGANHVAMLSESGQLYTVGRSDEGQLGRPHHRHLNPTPDNMRRHVRLRDEDGEVIEGAPEVRFERIAASGNITAAWTAAGECYACGSKRNEDLISDVFKRDPDHDNKHHIDWD